MRFFTAIFLMKVVDFALTEAEYFSAVLYYWEAI
jgi:hypothetical protein